jgi:hypothetical protein
MRARTIAVTLMLVSGACGDGEEAPRLPLPLFVDVGGPKLAHPQLVFISYANDLSGPGLADYSRWLVTSSWLETVGGEYGVGAGSVVAIEKPDAAPDEIDNSEIVDLLFAGLANGSLPAPTANTLYMFTFPGTFVTYGGSGGCGRFDSYHDSARRNGVEVAYAVVPSCGFEPANPRVTTIARVLIAAATDPFPAANPGWQLRERTSPWLAMGAEVSDLCRRGGDMSETVVVDGARMPRIWSNAAAAAGEDPCVPHTYGDTYFNVVPDMKTILRIRPGEHQTIQLEGFSTEDVGVFTLSAQPSMRYAATLTLGATKFGPGKSTTLDIALPSSAPIGVPVYSFVYSERDYGNYQWQFVPVPVMAGDPCSAFTDCLSCTARAGCGFCASSGRCEAFGASGSAESSCSGKAFATWAGSCPGFCESNNTSCGRCTAQRGCGWCAVPGTPGCMEASHDGSHPEVLSCPYADWSVEPSYCP